nr:hypothetical protein [Bacteroidaceae bacterium]
MKKYLYFAVAALFTACAADDVPGGGGDTPAPSPSKLVEKQTVSASFQSGAIGVKSVTGRVNARAGVDMETLYTKDKDGNVKEATASLAFFNLICNEASGLFHADNGWAVKSKAQGTQDNNRVTYCYYVEDDGTKTNLVKNNEQGLFLYGTGCDLSGWNAQGRVNAEIPTTWFDTQYASAQAFIDEAMKTTPKTGNYGMQNQSDGYSEHTFTYYEYQGYKVVLAEYDTDGGKAKMRKLYKDGEQEWQAKWEIDIPEEEKALYTNVAKSWDGSEYFVNDNMVAPWFDGKWNSWNTHVTSDPNAETPKVILVPTKNEITFNGLNINASIFAPGKKVSTLGGGAADGIIICDKFVTGAEIHGNLTPPFFPTTPNPTPDPTPGPTPDPTPDPTPETCEANIVVDLDIPGEYVVMPDDFAIHNGDKLYENVAISGQDHQAIAKGEGSYVKVEAGNKILVKVDDVCSLYPEYVGKVNAEGQPYINDQGVLTLEVYIWPGKIVEGQFVPRFDLGEGYIIGDENGPVEYLANNKNYTASVSAYKGVQGVGQKEDGGVDTTGWSYVKVSIHISPVAK